MPPRAHSWTTRRRNVRILVIEDDARMRDLIARGLREDGHAVDALGDGREAAAYLGSAAYDALILDVNLPGDDGFTVLRRLRDENNPIATLLLTARDAHEDVVRGLDLGADDYLRKPFHFAELEARLRSLHRRPRHFVSSVLEHEDVRFDTVSRSASRGGRPLDLTAKESVLLEVLLRNAGRVVTRRVLEEALWDAQTATSSNALDAYAARLRRKLADAGPQALLHTVRGIGYRFGDPL